MHKYVEQQIHVSLSVSLHFLLSQVNQSTYKNKIKWPQLTLFFLCLGPEINNFLQGAWVSLTLGYKLIVYGVSLAL